MAQGHSLLFYGSYVKDGSERQWCTVQVDMTWAALGGQLAINDSFPVWPIELREMLAGFGSMDYEFYSWRHLDVGDKTLYWDYAEWEQAVGVSLAVGRAVGQNARERFEDNWLSRGIVVERKPTKPVRYTLAQDWYASSTIDAKTTQALGEDAMAAVRAACGG